MLYYLPPSVLGPHYGPKTDIMLFTATSHYITPIVSLPTELLYIVLYLSLILFQCWNWYTELILPHLELFLFLFFVFNGIYVATLPRFSRYFPWTWLVWCHHSSFRAAEEGSVSVDVELQFVNIASGRCVCLLGEVRLFTLGHRTGNS